MKLPEKLDIAPVKADRPLLLAMPLISAMKRNGSGVLLDRLTRLADPFRAELSCTAKPLGYPGALSSAAFTGEPGFVSTGRAGLCAVAIRCGLIDAASFRGKAAVPSRKGCFRPAEGTGGRARRGGLAYLCLQRLQFCELRRRSRQLCLWRPLSPQPGRRDCCWQHFAIDRTFNMRGLFRTMNLVMTLVALRGLLLSSCLGSDVLGAIDLHIAACFGVAGAILPTGFDAMSPVGGTGFVVMAAHFSVACLGPLECMAFFGAAFLAMFGLGDLDAAGLSFPCAPNVLLSGDHFP